MRVITTGNTRTVIATKRWVIKIPNVHDFMYCEAWRGGRDFLWWFRRMWCVGVHANRREIEFSRTGWVRLCPVVFHIGSLVVVMPRAEPLGLDDWFALNHRQFVTMGNPRAEDFYEFSLGCAHDGVEVYHPPHWARPEHGLIPAENKPSSFGKLNGRVVAVDYG